MLRVPSAVPFKVRHLVRNAGTGQQRRLAIAESMVPRCSPGSTPFSLRSAAPTAFTSAALRSPSFPSAIVERSSQRQQSHPHPHHRACNQNNSGRMTLGAQR